MPGMPVPPEMMADDEPATIRAPSAVVEHALPDYGVHPWHHPQWDELAMDRDGDDDTVFQPGNRRIVDATDLLGDVRLYFDQLYTSPTPIQKVLANGALVITRKPKSATITGLAAWLGVGPQTIKNNTARNDPVGRVLTVAVATIADLQINKADKGDASAQILMAEHGMASKSEHTVQALPAPDLRDPRDEAIHAHPDTPPEAVINGSYRRYSLNQIDAGMPYVPLPETIEIEDAEVID